MKKFFGFRHHWRGREGGSLSKLIPTKGKANIVTGNGMQLKTFTPGVEDVDGMPASKGEGQSEFYYRRVCV